MCTEFCASKCLHFLVLPVNLKILQWHLKPPSWTGSWKKLTKMIKVKYPINTQKNKFINSIISSVREKTWFGQNRGYADKMAANSAILNPIKTKLGNFRDNTLCNIPMHFDDFRSKLVFLVIFFVFIWKQNGRQSRHLWFDSTEILHVY